MAWAGSSRMRQERLQAAWRETERFGTSISYYMACMRCSVGYLTCWGSSVVAACCIVEGLANKVRFVSWRADMARDIWILSGNRLLKHDIQLGIVFLSRSSGWSDVMGWAQNVYTERDIYLSKKETVFRKTNLEPYISHRPLTSLEKFLRVVPSRTRSGISRYSLAKFSKFSCGERYVKKFW